MIIKVLLENTSSSSDLDSEHGLSLYIESKDRKILFDTGASTAFHENAKKMGVDLSKVEYLILSHGHYDHGGGLEEFLRINKKAKIYIHKKAFGDYYALRENKDLDYIGIEKKIMNNKQIILTEGNYPIDEGIDLFTNTVQIEPKPKSNRNLFMDIDGEMVEDSFDHEQNLILKEDGKSVLITGCAHNGIINIIDNFKNLKGYMPNYVLGGFHLSGASANNQEDGSVLDKIGNYILESGAKYYTGHCTGIESYNILKEKMQDNIEYLAGGRLIEI